jgi:hypothetical protein
MGFSRTLYDAESRRLPLLVARNLIAIAAPGCDGHHEMVVLASAFTMP